MKKIVVRNLAILVLFFLTPEVYAQFGSEEIGIPSPTATSLGVYGETPVSLYTGSINPSIPIHTANSGPLSLPITLTYNGSGVKVSEIPGWVGLSWALEAGGVITRVVRGKPDDQGTIGYLATNHLLEEFIDGMEGSSPGSSCPSFTDDDCLNYITEKIMPGIADSEQDHFYLNFPGGSGKFYLGLNDEVILSDYSPYEVSFDTPSAQTFTGGGDYGANISFTGIDKWTVKDASGNIYTFSAKEYSYDRTGWSSPLNGNLPYISAWYLTKIESANGDHVIDISYSSPVILDRSLDTFSNKFIALDNGCNSVGPSLSTQQMVTRYGLIWPDEITTSSERITFVTSTKASGLLGANEKRLDEIKVWNKSSNLKTVHSLTYNTSWSDRTRLVSVTPEDANGNELPKYELEYYATYSLPDPDSPNIDHWGYANGQNNPSLIPSQSVTSGHSYPTGANRNPSSTYYQTGMLKKINYPTGGYSLFEYENHDYGSVGENNVTSSFTDAKEEFLETNNAQQETYEISFIVASHDGSNVGIDISSSISNSLTHLTGTGPYTQILDDTNTSVYLHQHDAASTSNDTDYLTLAPGEYTLKLSDPYTNSSASIEIDWTNSFPATINSPGIAEDAGGPRIKKVTQHDGVSTSNDVVKTYTYKLENEPNRSSGVLARAPQYYYISYSGNLSLGRNGTYCTYAGLNAQSIFPIGSGGSMIEYDEVKEEITSASNVGYTYHKFNTSKDSQYKDAEIKINTWPYQVIGDKSKLRGGLSANLVYDNSDDLQQKTEISYSTLQSGTIESMAFKLDAPKDILNRQAAFYHIYDNYLFWHPKVEEKVSVYNGSGTPVVTETDYTYNLTNHQPQTVTVANSLTSEKRKTTYKYAYEVHNGTNGMDDKNMLTQPYSVLLENGSGTDLSKTWTIWSNSISGASSGVWLPKEQWVWDGTFTPTDPPSDTGTNPNDIKISTVLEYDDYGNALKIRDANSNITKYFYGESNGIGGESPFSQSGTNGTNGVYLTGIQKVKGTDNCNNCGTRPGSGDDLFSEAKYDGFGRVTKVIDENAKETEYSYDNFHRLVKTETPGGGVIRNSYFYSSAPTGAFSSIAPNYVSNATGTGGWESDFSSSTGISSSGDRTFNYILGGVPTVRIGDSGGNWSSVYRTPNVEDVSAKVDFYPGSSYTNSSGPYVLSLNDGTSGNPNRFSVRYRPSTDQFFIEYRKNSGSWINSHTFSLSAPPNQWYTVEVEKRKGILMAWVYEKGESRSSGEYYELGGFNVSWKPQVRAWSKDDYMYLAYLEIIEDPSSSISYLDGLGREIQTQLRGGNKVIATETLYNERGLPEVVSRPVEEDASSFPGFYNQGLLSGGSGFTPSSSGTPIPSASPVHGYYAPIVATSNDEDFAYSQTQYEASPLARVQKSTLPGISHQMGSGKEVITSYSLNTSETFATSAQTGLTAKTWAANTLSKTITEDPDGKQTITYTDGWGQTIASGVDMNTDGKLTRASTDLVTEFAYDERGNLVRVEDPRGLATTYIYNTLGQLESKNLPDQNASTDYKYDNKGRLRFVEHATHKQSGSAITITLNNQGSDFTEDIDPATTGVLSFDVSITTEYDDFDVWIADDAHSDEKLVSDVAPFDEGWESTASKSMIAKAGNYKVFGRVQNGWDGWETSTGTIKFKPFKYSYTKYDEFDRPTEQGEYHGSTAFNSANANSSTFPTSDRVKLVEYKYDDANAYSSAQNLAGRLAQVWYYDPNDLSVSGKTYYSYNSLGLVEWVKQDLPGITLKTINYTYDELGRLTRIHFDPSGSTDDHYFWYEYDELGRLETVKSYGSNSESSALTEAQYTYYADGQVEQLILGGGGQTVDYDYTIQGWLDMINNPSSMGSDVFASDLYYTNNGNISRQRWEQSGIGSSTYNYHYNYDNANRLTTACYGSTNSCTSSGDFDVYFSYDENGNIEHIDRNGSSSATDDYLNHVYETNKNRLDYVTVDGSTKQFSHDPLGNVTENQVQGIDNISYEWRNLPNWMVANGKALLYTYDAEGNRVKKELVDESKQYYIRGADGQTIAVYQGSTLLYINILAGGQIIGQIEN